MMAMIIGGCLVSWAIGVWFGRALLLMWLVDSDHRYAWTGSLCLPRAQRVGPIRKTVTEHIGRGIQMGGFCDAPSQPCIDRRTNTHDI